MVFAPSRPFSGSNSPPRPSSKGTWTLWVHGVSGLENSKIDMNLWLPGAQKRTVVAGFWDTTVLRHSIHTEYIAIYILYAYIGS